MGGVFTGVKAVEARRAGLRASRGYSLETKSCTAWAEGQAKGRSPAVHVGQEVPEGWERWWMLRAGRSWALTAHWVTGEGTVTFRCTWGPEAPL